MQIINLLLIAALMVLTANGYLAFRERNWLQISNEWVLHSHDTIETANQLRFSLIQAQLKVNQYLTSNQNQLDKKYIQGVVNQSYELLARLHKLTADNPHQAPRLNALQLLLDQEVQQFNVLEGSNNKTLILQNMRLGIYQPNLYKSLQIISDFSAEELQLLKIRNMNYKASIQTNNFLFAVTFLINYLLFIFSIIFINYDHRKQMLAEKNQTQTEQDLKIANYNLHLSEERYNLAITGSHTGLWDWEVGSDVMYYSKYLKAMLGYSEEELPNLVSAFQEHLHPDDLPRVKNAIAAHIKNKIPYDIEFKLRRKNGSYHWFHISGQAVWDEQGYAKRMVGSLIDITERKKAETRLMIQYDITKLLAEARNLDEIANVLLKTLCENLDWDFSALWMLDTTTQTLSCNRTWQRDPKQTHSYNDITQNVTFKSGIGLPGRVLASGKPAWILDLVADLNFPRARYAEESKLKSALCFPIILTNHVLGAIEVYTIKSQIIDQDLLSMMASVGAQIGSFVHRKMIESELRESEEYKTAILESASDSIMTINKNGTILSFNHQSEKIFGFTAIQLQHTNIEIILPGLMAKLNEIINKAAYETLGVKITGDIFPVDVTIAPMNINTENMYVITMRDITERKQIDIMKNEFVSVVSHELRTPLTSIRGSLGLILGGAVGSFSEKATKLLEIANKNCDRLLLLISDILDLEKLETGKMQFKFVNVNLDNLIKETILVNKMYGEKYGVTLQIKNSLPTIFVKVDPDRLMQVLANLVSNAIKFSRPGGVVEIDMQKMHEQVRVAVIDHGEGISTEFQSRIFKKFSQADSSNTRGKGGTGLGLNISKTIMEKMNGNLNFTTEMGKGATFYFDLPIVLEKIDNKTKNAARKNKRKYKLLICEDDEDQAAYLATLLESFNIEADIANSVAAAKKLLAVNQYYALILDLILPDQDGITFIRDLGLQERTKDLPIIVLSVMAKTAQHMLDNHNATVIDWLDKPIDFNKLLVCLNRIHPSSTSGN